MKNLSSLKVFTNNYKYKFKYPNLNYVSEKEAELIIKAKKLFDLNYFIKEARGHTSQIISFSKQSKRQLINNKLVHDKDYIDGYIKEEVFLKGEGYFSKLIKVPHQGFNPMPCLFLDRDGILNEIKNGKLTFYEDVKPIIEFCKSNSFYTIIITNQTKISRGDATLKEVRILNNKIKDYFQIDDLIFCPYSFKGNIDKFKKKSNLLKPNEGMVFEIMKKYSIDIDNSFMIGDKSTDALNIKGLKNIHLQREHDILSEFPIFNDYEEILNYIKEKVCG